jgi:arylsulfatase A-like enzyme
MKPTPLRLVVAILLMPVGWLAAAPGDLDNDGLRDSVETNTGVYVSPTNTGTNPAVADSDGDSLPDGMEVSLGTNPLDATSKVQRPNIILINCDDLGYGDLGCFWQNQRTGTQKFATPGIDALAAEGVMLTHHYVGAPVCGSSRSTLLQGRHQGHADIRDNLFNYSLPDNHSLATVLKRAGYHTVHVGKAGISGTITRTATNAISLPGHPMYRGFNEFFGYWSHYMAHEHYPQNGTTDKEAKIVYNFSLVTDANVDLYTTDAWTAYAKKAIVENAQQGAGRPLFLYLAYDAPHFKNQIPPTKEYPAGFGLNGGVQWTGSPAYASTATNDPAKIDNPANLHSSVNAAWPDVQKRYVSMIRRIDDSVSDIVQTLRDLNIAQNTLIVFTSDNGPSNEEGQEPRYFRSFANFEGIKRDIWEGGIRSPTIAWWPGQIPATNQVASPRVCTVPSGHWDWMSTFAEVAKTPAPSYTDGISLVPSLTGTGAQRDREYLYFEYNLPGGLTPNWTEFPNHRNEASGQCQAIRIGNFMGVRTSMTTTSQPFRIYNVTTDPGEGTNLASTLPALQARMQEISVSCRTALPLAPRFYDNALMPAVQLGAVTPGVKFKAFEGFWQCLPEFRTLTPSNEGQCAGFSTQALPKPTDCGVAYSAYLQVPVDGSYTFSVTSDAETSLWIHDANVIDNDYAWTQTKSSSTVGLKAGLHPIRLYYRHRTGTPTLGLSYSGPGISSQPIPLNSLLVEGVPPELQPDTLATKRDTEATSDVLANDTSSMPLSLVSAGPTLLGTTAIASNQLKLTPTAGTIGYDEFPYVATNGYNQYTSQVAATVLFDNEIWFPLEEGAGTSVHRVGGSSAVTGTLSGFANPATAWTMGRFRSALSFDGIDDHVDFPGLALPTGQQSRTFSCWLKTASKSSPELQALFSYGSNSTAGRFVVRLDNQANVASDQPLKLELGSGSGQITGTTPLNDGMWHHVAVVVDDHNGSGNVNVSETKLWVDGSLDPVSSTDGRELATGATLVPCLGGSNHNDGYNFTGKLDDVRFFDRALSDTEVQALYASRPIYLSIPADPVAGDDDGDGMSNEAEAIAGTDPDNASSVLHVGEFSVSGGTVSLKWMAFPGRDYQVEESTNLQSWLPVPGQDPVRIPPPASPGDPVLPTLLSVSFPSPGPSSHYYRLKVTLSSP